MTADSPVLYSVPEVAAKLGLSKPSVYRMMTAGDLGYVQLGRRRRVLGSQLEACLDAHRSDRASTR